MGMVTRICWRCDVCGFVWLKASERIPLQCPVARCRSRSWNGRKPRGRPRIIFPPVSHPKPRPPEYMPAHDSRCTCMACQEVSVSR